MSVETEKEIAVLSTKVDRLIKDVSCNSIRIARLEKLVYIAIGAVMLIQFSPMLVDYIDKPGNYENYSPHPNHAVPHAGAMVNTRSRDS